MQEDDKHLIYGDDQHWAVFDDLRLEYLEKNPFAMHEVLDRSIRLRLPLPDWAVDAFKATIVNRLTGKAAGRVGKDTTPIKTYRNKVIFEMRWRTYQSIMSWLPVQVRDFFTRPRVVHDFGIMETKWVAEYLAYFGPPGPPPDHILKILKPPDRQVSD